MKKQNTGKKQREKCKIFNYQKNNTFYFEDCYEVKWRQPTHFTKQFLTPHSWRIIKYFLDV